MNFKHKVSRVDLRGYNGGVLAIQRKYKQISFYPYPFIIAREYIITKTIKCPISYAKWYTNPLSSKGRLKGRLNGQTERVTFSFLL